MKREIENITRRRETSEKAIEEYLCQRTVDLGGLPLKYSSGVMTGYPDRCLCFPGALTVWVECKSKGKHATPLQTVRINDLRSLGFLVEVVDSREKVDAVIAEIARLMKAEVKALSGRDQYTLRSRMSKAVADGV